MRAGGQRPLTRGTAALIARRPPAVRTTIKLTITTARFAITHRFHVRHQTMGCQVLAYSSLVSTVTCCRSTLARILDLEGYSVEARALERIAEDDESFEYRSKEIDVTTMVTERLGLSPEDARVVSGLVLSIFDGPREGWDFDTAAPRLVRNATYAGLSPQITKKIKTLKSIWPQIRKRVLE